MEILLWILAIIAAIFIGIPVAFILGMIAIYIILLVVVGVVSIPLAITSRIAGSNKKGADKNDQERTN